MFQAAITLRLARKTQIFRLPTGAWLAPTPHFAGLFRGESVSETEGHSIGLASLAPGPLVGPPRRRARAGRRPLPTLRESLRGQLRRMVEPYNM
jgi:hypothetical protein